MESIRFYKEIVDSLSKARFESYRFVGEADREALCKYVWNILLCESLYPGFQFLEVGLRNSIHSQISRVSGGKKWLTNEIGFLFQPEKEAIQKSKASIQSRATSLTEDILVAEMSFGFWTSLLDTRYELMWPKIIKGVFPNMPKTDRTRKEASKLVNPVRKLRNAALHHHSIWHWKDLKNQHAMMKALIGYNSEALLLLYSEIDRFPATFDSGHKNLVSLIDKISSDLGSDVGHS
jgi:hypothetical protein